MNEIEKIRLFLLVAKYLDKDGTETKEFWASISDETLIEATKNIYTDVQLSAINILKERKGEEVGLALNKATKDTNSDVSQAAALALQERQMNEWNNKELIQAIKDHHNSRWTLTRAAINTLKKREISESDAKALIKIANRGYDFIRRTAVSILVLTEQGKTALRKELGLTE